MPVAFLWESLWESLWELFCYVSRFLIKYLALMYNKNWGLLNAGSE